MKHDKTPLVLVFYLDREMMEQTELFSQFTKSINSIIEYKKANMIAIFLPKSEDTDERVECINPAIATEEQKENINKLIEDIKVKFSINTKFDDVPDEINE